MNQLFDCKKIYSSFKKDCLHFPKKGKCKLNGDTLILLVKKNREFYDQENEDIEVELQHTVKILFS